MELIFNFVEIVFFDFDFCGLVDFVIGNKLVFKLIYGFLVIIVGFILIKYY